MYEDLNDIQSKVFEFIKSYIENRKYAPSIKEICKNLSIKSTSTAHKTLIELEEKGYIVREPSRNRAIAINDDKIEETIDNNVTSIPMLGVVAAGRPIFAYENIDEYIPIPNQWLGIGEYFMLKVEGDSMIDTGIFDGDYLIVQKTEVTRNGEIVVALINGEETTVKRFYKEKDGRIRLQPENPMYEAIYAKDVRILGRVKKSIRNFF